MRGCPPIYATHGVARLQAIAVLSGVGTAMLGLAIALAVAGGMGSVLDAGLVLGVHAIALAAGAPVGGRLSDRWGPRPVLVATALLQAGGGAWLVTAVATAAPTLVLGFAAAVVGLANPPSSSVTRSHWPALVATGQLRSAYAVDSALTSATVVAGPPLAALASHAASPTAAIVVALAAKVLGALLLSTISGLATASARRADGRLRAWSVRSPPAGRRSSWSWSCSTRSATDASASPPSPRVTAPSRGC